MSDPLGWPGHAERLARARARSGAAESVGWVRWGGAVVVEFDFRFLGGSVGAGAGQALVDAFGAAVAEGLPVVSLIATGGSRVHEGVVALRQLQRVARARAEHRAAGLGHVAVLRDPTTGGGWAALGAGADVVLGVAGAQVGFAGSRVRPGNGPEYTAEGQFAAGSVDAVVAPGDVERVVADCLRVLAGRRDGPAEVPRALGRLDLPGTGWEAVRRARSAARPRAGAYLADHFDLLVPVRGDRAGGVDDGVVCGLGLRGDRAVAVAAQLGTATGAAGYRTVERLLRMAGRLGMPVLTLVDTPGAANGPEAERAGVGPAIAGVFAAVAESPVPVTTLVVGEGGSGGALALCAPGRTWLTPDSYFSVLAPELAGLVLRRGDVAGVAEDLRLRPQDVVELGAADGIAGAEPIG